MKGSSIRLGHFGHVLGAVGAFGALYSAILVVQDSLDGVSLAVTHISALALSLFAATCGGLLDRARTPWFGWLSYGALLASGGLVLLLGIIHVRTATWPKADLGLLVISLVVFAVSLPATLVARRRARDRLPW
jgi:hypothetical protein